MELKPQEKLKKLTNILEKASLLEEGKEVALAGEFMSLDSKIDDLDFKVKSVNENINSKLSDVAQAIRGIPKTEIPEPKDYPEFPKQIAITLPMGMTLKGDKGDKGETGKNGKDGANGKDGLNGIDGENGLNGENGKDGSPDSPEQIVEKLETLKGDERLDASAIKNLPKSSHGGGTVSQHFYQLQDVVFTDLQDNDIPVWNATDQRWENDTVAGASGIERNTASVAVDTTVGNTVKTDYVYFATATLTFTLPTAIGNTNLYIIKCLAGTTTINPVLGQTIDGSSSVTISVVNTALSLTSDGANWFVV